MPMPVGIRPLDLSDPSEVNYVLASWRNTIRGLHPYKWMPDWAFELHWQNVQLIVSRRATVYVACNPSDVSQLFGWAAGEDGVLLPSTHPDKGGESFLLYFSYVAKPWRQQGIARRLVTHLFPRLGKDSFIFAERTRDGCRLARMYKADYYPQSIIINALEAMINAQAEAV